MRALVWHAPLGRARTAWQARNAPPALAGTTPTRPALLAVKSVLQARSREPEPSEAPHVSTVPPANTAPPPARKCARAARRASSLRQTGRTRLLCVRAVRCITTHLRARPPAPPAAPARPAQQAPRNARLALRASTPFQAAPAQIASRDTTPHTACSVRCALKESRARRGLPNVQLALLASFQRLARRALIASRDTTQLAAYNASFALREPTPLRAHPRVPAAPSAATPWREPPPATRARPDWSSSLLLRAYPTPLPT